MADRTSIEWTRGDDGSPGSTWNPIGGCTRVSSGCVNCYAEVMAARFSDPGQWGHGLAERVRLPDGGIDHRWTGKVRLNDHRLDQPLRWKKPRRVFVNSTSDLFHEAVPNDWIDQVFAVMALAPQHTFLILTKRPERMRDYLGAIDAEFHAAPDDLNKRFGEHCAQLSGDPCAAAWLEDHVNWPLPNVWLGTSIEDQATADARIPHLLATPAAVRFISAEPLLGPVDLTSVAFRGGAVIDALRGRDIYSGRLGPSLDWVITGGESGPGARPMHPDWARSLRDQCVAAGVAYFHKQNGNWLHESQPKSGWAFWDAPLHEWPDGSTSIRLRKGDAGRDLDGRTWDQMPALRRADG